MESALEGFVVLAILYIAPPAIVLGAALVTKRRAGTIGIDLILLAGLVILAQQTFVGPLTTRLSTPTLATWWWAPALRCACVGVGIAAFAIGMVRMGYANGRRPLSPVGFWIFTALVAAGSPALALNPFRDLLGGPASYRATGLEASATHGIRASVFGTLHLVGDDGVATDLSLAGWGATDAQNRLRDCDLERDVSVSVLRHLGRVVDVRCTRLAVGR